MFDLSDICLFPSGFRDIFVLLLEYLHPFSLEYNFIAHQKTLFLFETRGIELFQDATRIDCNERKSCKYGHLSSKGLYDFFINCCKYGNISVVKHMVESDGLHGYFKCSKCNDIRSVNRIEDNATLITAKSNMAIRFAARHGQLQIIKYLLSHGADLSAARHCALRWSISSCHPETTFFLQQHLNLSKHEFSDMLSEAYGPYIDGYRKWRFLGLTSMDDIHLYKNWF